MGTLCRRVNSRLRRGRGEWAPASVLLEALENRSATCNALAPFSRAQAVQASQAPFIALVVSPVGASGQCIDVGTGLAVPSAWFVAAPFPVQRLSASYPDPAIVASPLSTLAIYVKSAGNATNVTMAYKHLVAALGLTTSNNGYDIALCAI